MRLFQRFFRHSQPQRQTPKGFNQTFILEPILTPSGLVDVDGGDDGFDLDGIDLPDLQDTDIPDFIPEPFIDDIDDANIEPVDFFDADGDPEFIADNSTELIEPVDFLEADSDANLAIDNNPELELIGDIDLPEEYDGTDGFLPPLIDDLDNKIPTFEKGIFTVGDSGEVGIDFLFDGGGYEGELAIFNLEGMDEFDFDNPEEFRSFILEASERALSDSNLGHVLISDLSEGAKFSGTLPEGNFNSGDYLGVKTVAMNPGDKFAVMLVPNGSVQEIHNLLDSGEDLPFELQPLFSLSTANPKDAFHLGQIADVTGDGNTFALEDLRTDGWTDRDYNDIVFQVRGATGDASLMDEVVNPNNDWRGTDIGQALIEYAKPYVEPEVTDTGIEIVDGDSVELIDEIEISTTEADTTTDEIDSPICDKQNGLEETGSEDTNSPNQTTDSSTEVSSNEVEQNSSPSDKSSQTVVSQWMEGDIKSDDWTQSLIEYVDAAIDSGDKNVVVNLSLNLTEIDGDGNVVPRYELTDAELDALAYAQQHNVLVVVPAGDNPETISVLGQASLEFDNIVTVGSAERVNSSVSVWKGYDSADSSGSGYALSLVADGSNGEFISTSVAAAKVKEAVTQVWAANPKLSYRQVIDILQRTATDLKTHNWDFNTGSGLLNLAAAVHLAKVTPPIDVDVPLPWLNFGKVNQPLIGIIDTGFNSKNPDIDYRRLILGRDRINNDDNPLLETGEGNEHGTHILGIIGATQGNGIGIDGMNDDAPIWLGRAIGSGKWAESLREFVDAAKVSGQPNAVVNLSFDLTQTNPDGTITTRYELTPQEREALEYARQNGVLVVVAAGNSGGTMSALGQASQEFDNLITVGAIDNNGKRTDYSSYGYGLDFVARGGKPDEQVLSTVGEGVAVKLLTSDEEPPEDEMSANAKAAFEEAFGSVDETEEIDEAELENLTPEERQVYEEATQEIDRLLNDYLGAASQKIALEYVDGYYAAQVDTLSRFVEAFDENTADTLLKAQDLLAEAGLTTDISTDNDLDFSIPLDLGIGGMAGTSVAAAKVTGVVSQVWAANPALSYPQVKEILKQTAVDLGQPGWDIETGSGLVDIAAAVELAKQTQPQAYQPTPLQSPLTWSGEGKVTPGERAVSVSVPSFTGRVMNAGYVTTVGYLRIRSGPGTDYAEVGRKYPGEAITFDAYENNGRWVPDPSMPGGGSSRWYKIAGTNYWMSALYIDNTPEQAEQERQRQEAIRRAEEEARRAEEELRRAEEEARRAEEELRRLEEEQRRQREQLLAAINQVSQKIGDLGTPVGSYLSNGVRVYQFAKGNLFVQPDGNYGFYEVSRQVGKFFNPSIEGSFGNYVAEQFTDPFFWSAEIIANRKEIADLGQYLSYKKLVSPGKNGFVTFVPRFGKYSEYVDESLSFLSKRADQFDNFLAFKSVNPGKNGFVLPRFGSTEYARFVKNAKFAEKGIGIIGTAIGLIPDAVEYFSTSDPTRQREIAVKAALETTGSIIGGSFGTFVGTFIPIPGATLVGGFVGGLAGGYLGSVGADFVNDHWDSINNTVQSGWNAVSSFTNSTIEAAKQTAQAVKEKAQAAAAKAKEAYQVAQATVQQAKAVYQTFKQEVQQRTTQIVQQSQQKIKEEAQRIAQRVAQAAPKVFNRVATYANKAVQAVSNVINGAKQFVSNVIETGKRIVNNIIDTGKRAYETVKNTVVNAYETGKRVVTETFNNAVNTVTNTFSGGFNRMKSVFGW